MNTMQKVLLGIATLILLLTACKNNEQKADESEADEAIAIRMIKSDAPIVQLNPTAKELTNSWPEYERFDDLISQYQEISMNEALLNSVELSVLAQQLRDSIRVEKLNIPEVKTRLNVLYSETLRLADMSTIPTVTEKMVAEENNDMIDAYSALNLKINNMNRREELNSEISSFVDEVLQEKRNDSVIRKPPKVDSIMRAPTKLDSIN